MAAAGDGSGCLHRPTGHRLLQGRHAGLLLVVVVVVMPPLLHLVGGDVIIIIHVWFRPLGHVLTVLVTLL
jgi:hypothetical protein